MAHAGSLVRREEASQDEAVALYEDWRSAALSEQDRVMLTYVEKLTYLPSSTTEEDLHQLRAVGFSDENIVDIVMLTGYRAMLNRLHDGLGLSLDQFYERQGAAFVDRFPGADR